MNTQKDTDLLVKMKDHECLYCKHKLDCQQRAEALVLYEQYIAKRDELCKDWDLCSIEQFYVKWRCSMFEPISKVNDDICFQYDKDSSLAIGTGRVVYIKDDKPQYFVCKPNSDIAISSNKYYGPTKLIFPKWKCDDDVFLGKYDKPTYENRIVRCPNELRKDPNLFLVDIENVLSKLDSDSNLQEAMRIVDLTKEFNRDRI